MHTDKSRGDTPRTQNFGSNFDSRTSDDKILACNIKNDLKGI